MEEGGPIDWLGWRDTNKDTQEMCFEIVNCHFCGIAAMTSQSYEFEGETIHVMYMIFHVGMFLWSMNLSRFEFVIMAAFKHFE